MNVLYMKYAVEIAKAGSVNRAAEKLYVAQPNLSRAVKELEADLGISLFKRTAKGMTLTRDGERFVAYAERILKEMDDLRSLFGGGAKNRIVFSLSAPGSCRISAAFAEFAGLLPPDAPSELTYEEASAKDTLDRVLYSGCRLGIIRYLKEYDVGIKEELDDKGLRAELLCDSVCDMIVSAASPLAERPVITEDDLAPLTEVVSNQLYVPRDIIPDGIKNAARLVTVSGRAARFELLQSNSDTYMRDCGITDGTLEKYRLVRKSDGGATVCRDVLICKNGYRFTDYDRLFISRLKETLQNK